MPFSKPPFDPEAPVNARWMLAGLMAAAPLALARSAQAAPQAQAGLAEGVVKRSLPNGMTLLVKPLHSAPVVAVNAWVRVGSVHEREAERGITHYIEHMLFKGTDKLKVGELDRLIKAAGGYNNAHTRYESTDFIDVVPAAKLDVALESMAEAMQHSTFDGAELDRERKVVLEELSRAQDNPSFEAWNRLTHLAFEQHPYKHPIIGYKPLLEKMDRQLLVDYWERWYRPQNIIVVIVGDVDANAALDKAEAAFGGWTAGKDKPGKLPKEGGQKGLRALEEGGDIQTTIAVLGFPSCAELDPDCAALDMGLAILGSGLSSRLNQEVRERQKLAHSLAAAQFNGAYPGLAYLWAELEPDQVKPALRAVWAQVQRMQVEPVSEEELERQRVRLEHDEASERMSMEGLAGRLGYYEALAGDYREVDEGTKRMRAVKPADIQRVMKKYFDLSRANLVVYRPAKAKPTGLDAKGWTAWLEGAPKAEPLPSPAEASQPLPTATAIPTAKAAAGAAAPEPQAEAGGLTRYRLSSGGTLLVKPARHAPLVAASFYFPSGLRVEPASQSGALNLLARTLLKGLPGMDAQALATQMDALGLGIGPSADPDRFSVGFQALASKVGPSLALAGRVLREASLPEEELAKERERVLKDIKDKSDSPDEYVSDLFAATFFGAKHPYGRPIEGTAATLKGLKRPALLALKDQVLRPEQLLAVVVGDIEPAEAYRLFEAEFGAQAWSVAGTAPKLAKLAPFKPGPRRKAAKLPKKQAHIFLGWPAPSPTHPDYTAIRLINSILGEGMDSRLFHEVREKRGLCYTVYSSFDRRLDPGAWRVYVATEPSQLKQAEAVCREVVAKLAKEGVSAAELESAKAYAKGIFQVARQDFGTDARVIANYESWGLGAAAVEQVAAKIDAVTLADCKRVAKQWLKPDKAVVAVVKP